MRERLSVIKQEQGSKAAPLERRSPRGHAFDTNNAVPHLGGDFGIAQRFARDFDPRHRTIVFRLVYQHAILLISEPDEIAGGLGRLQVTFDVNLCRGIERLHPGPRAGEDIDDSRPSRSLNRLNRPFEHVTGGVAQGVSLELTYPLELLSDRRVRGGNDLGGDTPAGTTCNQRLGLLASDALGYSSASGLVAGSLPGALDYPLTVPSR